MKQSASSTRVLYTSADLHEAIQTIFRSPTRGERRVALVAYVGAGAEAFLPDARGLEVICSLTPGATSAETLIRLRQRGARLAQSSALHMKVYWSSVRGAVICSANASRRALARNGLKEAGVFIPSRNLDVARLIRYVRPRPITNENLRRLGRSADLLAAARPADLPALDRDEVPTLAEWLSSSAHRRFRLGAITGHADISHVAKAVAKRRFNVSRPYSFMGIERRRDAEAGDWILMFDAKSGRDAEWLYVNFVVALPRAEMRGQKRRTGYEAVQLYPNRNYPAPPFLLERVGRQALARAVKAFDRKELERSTLLSRSFCHCLRKNRADH